MKPKWGKNTCKKDKVSAFACSGSVKLHGCKCNLITPISCRDVKGVFLQGKEVLPFAIHLTAIKQNGSGF